MRIAAAGFLALIFYAAPAACGVVRLDLVGPVGPIAVEYLDDGIARAAETDAQLVVLVLDTPGGLDASMRDIVRAIFASRVPVAVYVAPDGARAASAGVFLLAAAHVAAMAPATNTGAAHPVNMGGQLDETMAEKVTNDAVAYLQSVAARRGRSGSWCERVVRSSASVPADTALALGMIDVVAADLDELIAWCDGRTFETPAGPVVADLGHAAVESMPMSARQKLLRQIVNPNVAYILMMIGVYGLFFELSRPGAILPGIVGGISLILAVVAFQALPVNTAGLLLILLGLVLLLLEIKVTSFGMLALGGVAALFLGSMLLFRGDSPLGQLSLRVVVPMVVVTAALLLGVAGLGLRAQMSPPRSGVAALVGAAAVVRRIDGDGESAASGVVEVSGELWSFAAGRELTVGDRVVVESVDGRTLNVRPAYRVRGDAS